MSFDHLRTAAVIEFPYLWAREAQRGETEGRKKRPVVVAVRLARPNGGDAVLLLPITTRPPRPGQPSAEIPEMEKRRAGLHADARLWIILDEYNHDVIGRSFYLEPAPALGHFSKAFFLPLLKAFVAHRETVRRVTRQL